MWLQKRSAKKPSQGENKPLPKKLVDAVGRAVFPQLASRLIHDGRIRVGKKADTKLRKELFRSVRELLQTGELQLNYTIDHRKRLLAEGRSSLRKGDLEMAALFYATYFEHQMNGIIADLCERKGLQGLTKQIVRETSLVAKCTWVLELLGCKPIGAPGESVSSTSPT